MKTATPGGDGTTYTVALDTFHGPLDLLLYLVKRNEVDILDIPISKISEQFLVYLRAIEFIDFELAGDFLVMAATLMEIKSRALLPVEVAEEAEDLADPRRELVRQLLEYRKYKDAASALEKQAERAATRMPRTPEAEPRRSAEPVVKPVELWDLVSAFARLMRETLSLRPTTITIDDTPQEIYERRVLEALQAAGRMTFRDLFTPPYTRSKLIGLFLAILELIKRQAIWVEQPEAFGELWLSIRHAERQEAAGEGNSVD